MKNRGILVFIISIIAMVYLINSTAYSITPLITCFDAAGAEFIQADIEGYAVIATDNSPEEIASKMFDSLNAGNDVKGYWQDNMFIIKSSSEDRDILVKTKEVVPKKKVYTSVKVSQYKTGMNINNIWRAVSKSFSYYRVQPSYSSLIYGKFNGQLTQEKMQQKVNEILKKSNANFVDHMSEKNIVSVCGYSPEIKDYILDAGKKMNLNVALRYSESYGCTYISIGSPIIAVEY